MDECDGVKGVVIHSAGQCWTRVDCKAKRQTRLSRATAVVAKQAAKKHYNCRGRTWQRCWHGELESAKAMRSES